MTEIQQWRSRVTGSGWNTQIIEEFRANSGRVGGPFTDAALPILHTVGAKTAKRELATYKPATR